MITELVLALALLQPDPASLARAEAYFADTDGQAMLVMHRGRIIHEKYRAGGSEGQRQMLASGSKSFVGLAAVAAVNDKLLSLDQPVSTWLTDWRNDARKNRITVRQLLALESGLESGNPGTGCGGPGATWNDALQAGTFAEPGSTFRYGPYPFLVAGAVIERVQSRSFADYLEQRILDPLGIEVEWRARCGDGKPQLAGGAAMTARHWATLGEFIRQGGVHQGKRLLPASLVQELFRPAAANPNYGLSWWLVGATLQAQPALGLEQARGGRRAGRLGARRAGRVGARGRGETRADATAGGVPEIPAWMPKDLVMAAGAGKQRLYVIPSKELVIVRLGPLTRGRQFDDAQFLGALFGAPAS